ncbi:MAG: hypothetical protein WBP72_17530 [Rhodocyclaceae bacterium]
MALSFDEATPARFRQHLHGIARDQRWDIEEFVYQRVGEPYGSSHATPIARVRLSHVPKNAVLRTALVGRCVCTGGEDHRADAGQFLDSSAVVLSLMQAVAETSFPLRIDTWLAVVGPPSLSVGDGRPRFAIARRGVSIDLPEIDLASRDALVDLLCEATRSAPHIIIDFATLSGALSCALPSLSGWPLFRPSGGEDSAPGSGGDTFSGGAERTSSSCSPVWGQDGHLQGASSGFGRCGRGPQASAATKYALSWGVELLARWLEGKPANSKPRLWP